MDRFDLVVGFVRNGRRFHLFHTTPPDRTPANE
jgi:hypothetical protein